MPHLAVVPETVGSDEQLQDLPVVGAAPQVHMQRAMAFLFVLLGSASHALFEVPSGLAREL